MLHLLFAAHSVYRLIALSNIVEAVPKVGKTHLYPMRWEKSHFIPTHWESRQSPFSSACSTRGRDFSSASTSTFE